MKIWCVFLAYCDYECSGRELQSVHSSEEKAKEAEAKVAINHPEIESTEVEEFELDEVKK